MGRTYLSNSRVGFAVDPHSLVRNGGVQVDWDRVSAAYQDSAAVVTMNGAATAADTSITVDPLPIPLFAGQTLYFGQTGEFALVTAFAAAGATSVSVQALPQGLEDNDTATVGGAGAKVIPAGTVVCKLTGGKVVPRAIRPGSETAIGILESDAIEGAREDALSGYGCIIGGAIYENLLPEASGSPAVINSTYKTELQTAGVGTGFAFYQYADDSGA